MTWSMTLEGSLGEAELYARRVFDRLGIAQDPDLVPGDPGTFTVAVPGDPPTDESVFGEPGSVVLGDSSTFIGGATATRRTPEE